MVWWCVLWIVVIMGNWCLAGSADNGIGDTGDDEYILKQVVWKRCYRKLSPACLKLSLVRTVEMMSKDSSLSLVPGVYFTSNSSGSDPLPPEISRSLSSDHAPLDDLVSFSLRKYLRSLTLNVNLVDFFSGGNQTLQNSVIDVFTGRGKNPLGGYGVVAAMMGGMMASMMMAGLAALAGKALMTSLAALMMAAFAAMKGGGGGDHESKTYEVITKPIVSHVSTHSAEVQHDHHGHYHHRRSLERLEENIGDFRGYNNLRNKRSLHPQDTSINNKHNKELSRSDIKNTVFSEYKEDPILNTYNIQDQQKENNLKTNDKNRSTIYLREHHEMNPDKLQEENKASKKAYSHKFSSKYSSIQSNHNPYIRASFSTAKNDRPYNIHETVRTLSKDGAHSTENGGTRQDNTVKDIRRSTPGHSENSSKDYSTGMLKEPTVSYRSNHQLDHMKYKTDLEEVLMTALSFLW